MSKPLIAEGAYPNLNDLCPDHYAARVLSSAYATSAGELNASLQYIYHSIAFLCANDSKRADLLRSIAIAEMKHIYLLGEALTRLGSPPVYSFNPPAQFNFYSTKFVAYSRTLKNMIEDDIMGEKYAIYCYERMLPRLKNDVVKRLVCRILEDEQLHLDALKSSLEGLSY
ncbi:MAG: manganese catalase family protein [Clostridia bacterium]|nr:manganese catalase family protein [Clostridia bacterium]